MKLELDISDELWKRIEFSAKLFRKSPDAYLRELLEDRVLRIPDPSVQARIDQLRATAGPEDDYDIDEFLEALERNRGHGRPVGPDWNGGPIR